MCGLEMSADAAAVPASSSTTSIVVRERTAAGSCFGARGNTAEPPSVAVILVGDVHW